MTQATMPDIRTIEQFLYQEADLLDRQRYDDWNALFTDDGDYWVPASVGQPDPLLHVSHIHEDRLLRAVRIKRFNDPNAFSVNPPPRAIHLVSNVRIADFDAATALCVVRSNVIVTQYRRGEKVIFTGRCEHRLDCSGDGFRIRRKTVELIDCDGPQGDILIYL